MEIHNSELIISRFNLFLSVVVIIFALLRILSEAADAASMARHFRTRPTDVEKTAIASFFYQDSRSLCF